MIKYSMEIRPLIIGIITSLFIAPLSMKWRQQMIDKGINVKQMDRDYLLAFKGKLIFTGCFLSCAIMLWLLVLFLS